MIFSFYKYHTREEMIGVYFSGTGNTKYCIEKFMNYYNEKSQVISIEDKTVTDEIKRNKDIVLAYPIYYSNLPKIVRDFITFNRELFYNKNIFIIATMGLFSGDGTGCSARLLQRYNANIIGGVHLQMPDCVGDVKFLKKPLQKNKQIINAAEAKIKVTVDSIKKGTPPNEGLGIFYHLAGLFGQRLWFYNKTLNYTEKLKIDSEKCIGCSKCVNICPMNNLNITSGIAISGRKCTMCYRCVNNCPQRAITLIGKKILEQCKIENYLDK